MSDALIIYAPKDYPGELIDDLANSLPEGLSLKRQALDLGLMAALEWAMPTLVVAYILKPFFEAFLKEAGKDTYDLTKSKLKKLIAKTREVKVTRIAASQSPDKLSKNYDQSLAISIKAQLHDKIKVTVLISDFVPDNDIEKMLDGMFASLMMLYSEISGREVIDESGDQGVDQLYLVADLETKRWQLLTGAEISARYNKTNKGSK